MPNVHDIKIANALDMFRETLDLSYYETRAAALADAFKTLGNADHMDDGQKSEVVAELVKQGLVSKAEVPAGY